MILTCKQLVRAATEAREQRLSALDRLGYRAHLLRCGNCRRYVAQLDAVVTALHGLPPTSAAPADARAAALQAFRDAKRGG